jgi:hypothetical protein
MRVTLRMIGAYETGAEVYYLRAPPNLDTLTTEGVCLIQTHFKR